MSFKLTEDAGVKLVDPGVSLSCNDFHIRYYDSRFKPDRNVSFSDNQWFNDLFVF